MSATVWYKHYPSDFLNGVADLSAEERGVLVTLIDMMYDQGGSIVDNPSRLARRCGCSTRRFNQIKTRLLEAEKLVHTDDRLYNKRVLKSLKPEFISELSRKYLILNFPELNKIKGLTPRKKPDSRIHKKYIQKNDQEGAGVKITPPDPGSPNRHLFDHVCGAYGEGVWLSWFGPGRAQLFGTVLHPRTKFIRSKIATDYEEALTAAGFTLAEME